jgi:cytidine deaminase
MQQEQYHFNYEVYQSIEELSFDDMDLLQQAKIICEKAYAPYSHFLVGAAAILSNGKIITGTNQENASYPVGICAERTLLSTAGTVYPESHIVTMAISYRNAEGNNNIPVSPCGMCRQALVEHETRYQHPVRLILGGMQGIVYIIPQSNFLLPLNFSIKNLKG